VYADGLEIHGGGLEAVIDFLTELDGTLARVERLLTEETDGEEDADA